MPICYHIPPLHQSEADVRLADAMVYAALKSALGERIEPFNTLHMHDATGPIWGPDPFHEDRAGLRMRQDACEHPAVIAALGGGRFVPAHEAQAEMDRLAETGQGAALRSLADPVNWKRFLQPGDDFETSRTHLGISTPYETVFIHPHRDAIYERRYLVVAGEIAGESPLVFCEEDPGLLLDPANRAREARLPWHDLEDPDPDRIARERAAAEALLVDFPMASGAIDVGVTGEDGAWTAHVLEVIPARPGDVMTLFADPVAYADAIATHLSQLAPDLGGAETPSP